MAKEIVTDKEWWAGKEVQTLSKFVDGKFIPTTVTELKSLAKRSTEQPPAVVHFMDPKKIVWNNTIRARTGCQGVIDCRFVVFKGRCGPDSFGVYYSPVEVEAIRNRWASRKTEVRKGSAWGSLKASAHWEARG